MPAHQHWSDAALKAMRKVIANIAKKEIRTYSKSEEATVMTKDVRLLEISFRWVMCS